MSDALFLFHREIRSSARSRAMPAMPTAPWRVWLRRRRVRKELAILHHEQLRDVGLDPDAVHAETLKPFWRS